MASPALRRRVSYPLIGACLAQGAAAGLLFCRLAGRRELSVASVKREVARNLGTYAYIASSTTVVFSLFGRIVGRYTDQLAALAATDPLTRLLNARAFRHRFHQELARAVRYEQPLSLLLVDLDGLKQINDQHGHEAGDAALGRVAASIRNGLREADVGARIGGDEFTILAPNTDQHAAIVFGERLRALVAETPGPRAGRTISVGIASFQPAPHALATERSLMRAADAALYRAKRAGGDRVVPAAVPSPSLRRPDEFSASPGPASEENAVLVPCAVDPGRHSDRSSGPSRRES